MSCCSDKNNYAWKHDLFHNSTQQDLASSMDRRQDISYQNKNKTTVTLYILIECIMKISDPFSSTLLPLSPSHSPTLSLPTILQDFERSPIPSPISLSLIVPSCCELISSCPSPLLLSLSPTPSLLPSSHPYCLIFLLSHYSSSNVCRQGT